MVITAYYWLRPQNVWGVFHVRHAGRASLTNVVNCSKPLLLVIPQEHDIVGKSEISNMDVG